MISSLHFQKTWRNLFSGVCILTMLVTSGSLKAQNCGDNSLFVIPGGTGPGTKSAPTNIVSALLLCKQDTTRHKIKMSTGFYNLNKTLLVPSGVTVEGGYDVTSSLWVKSSTNKTTLSVTPPKELRKTTDTYGKVITVGHYIGIKLDSVKNITLKDFRLETHKLPGAYPEFTDEGAGLSVYGVYSRRSKQIYLISLNIATDPGGEGMFGESGDDGRNANGVIPGGAVTDASTTNDNNPNVRPAKQSNPYRIGGTGGKGGRLQQFVLCRGEECLSSTCVPEYPAPRGENGGGSGGGQGAVCGDACAIDCYYEFYVKQGISNLAKEFLNLPTTSLKNPYPQPGKDGSMGSSVAGGKDFQNQEDQPPADWNDFFIPIKGTDGGDGAGGGGGGGGGAGGIRTLALPPTVPGSPDPYSKAINALNDLHTAVAVTGVPLCQNEVLNKSSNGGNGGAGGEGGGGGKGGHGGGASIGILARSGSEVLDFNCSFDIGEGGKGGYGGYGGVGGEGSYGWPSQSINDGGYSIAGSKGGDGGRGGYGGRGQRGSKGESKSKIGVIPSSNSFFLSDAQYGCTNSVISLFNSGGGNHFHAITGATSDVPLLPGFSSRDSYIQVWASDTGILPVRFNPPIGTSIPAPVKINTIRPLPAFNVPSTICMGNSVNLQADQAFAYAWTITGPNGYKFNSDKRNITFKPKDYGIYAVTYQAYDECCGFSVPQKKFVSVPQVKKPTIVKTSKAPYCYGTDSLRIDVTSEVNHYDKIQWSNGDTVKRIWVKEPGKYAVTFIDLTGCSATSDSVENEVFPLPEGKPTITKDLYNVCDQRQFFITPDYEPGMKYNFYNSPAAQTPQVYGNKVFSYAFQPYFPLGDSLADYYIRNVNSVFLGRNNYEVNCVGKQYSKVVLHKEKQPPYVNLNGVGGYIPAESGLCGKYYYYDYPKAYDNCSQGVNITVLKMPQNHFYPIGETIDSLRYCDFGGNCITVGIRINIYDNSAPVISSLPGVTGQTINNDPGKCSAYYPFTLAKATDNCSSFPATKGFYPEKLLIGGKGFSSVYIDNNYKKDSLFNVGKTTVYQTWVDERGNKKDYSFNLNVKDNEGPKVNCPVDGIKFYVGKGEKAVYTGYNAISANDNCDPEYFYTATFQSGFGQFGLHSIGTTKETWTATDRSGNYSSCTFNLSVLDTIKPTISCDVPVSMFANVNTDSAQAVFNLPPASDNSDKVTVTTLSKGSGAYYKLGRHELVYTAADSSGNTASCKVLVMVNDLSAPAIQCPANIVKGTDQGACDAKVAFSISKALDNDGLYYSPVKVLGLDSGATFPLGVTTQIYEVYDNSGNRSSCAFYVTVKDTVAPVITNCPNDTTVYVNTFSCTGIVNEPVLNVTENSCSTPRVGLHAGLIYHFPVGVTNQEYWATDGQFNSGKCAYKVTVLDTNTLKLTCPPNVEVSSDPGVCGAIVNFNSPKNSPQYNACYNIKLLSAQGSGSLFIPGQHLVRYEVEANGKTATCSLTVKVNDTEVPKINTPDNIVVHIDSGACGKNVTFTTPVGVDNCTGILHTQKVKGLNSGELFPIGTTTEKYITFDILNVDSAVFTVTVIDTIAPKFKPMADITEHTSEMCGKPVFFNGPTATDNSSCYSITQIGGLQMGDPFPIGTTKEIFVVKDNAGNTDTLKFNVTVVLDKPAVIACPPDVVVPSDNGFTKVVWYDVPGRFNSCVGVNTFLTSGKGSGATFPAGKTREEYLITTTQGDSLRCGFNVIVTEHTEPYVFCESQILTSVEQGSCGAMINLKKPVVDDYGGSGLSKLIMSYNTDTIHSFDFVNDTTIYFPAGYAIINWLAFDYSSNKGYCQTQILVQNSDKPRKPLKSFHACEGQAVELNASMQGPGPYTFEWITFNPDSNRYIIISRDSMMTFNPVKFADGIQYAVRVISECKQTVYQSEMKLWVDTAPAVTLVGLDTMYCVSDTVGKALSFTPAGGYLIGEGIVGNNFYPSLAGVGKHYINYSYYDSTLSCPGTATLLVNVYGLPKVEEFLDTIYCANAGPIQLDAMNSSYSGAGISGSIFNPLFAGPGAHTITRTVTVKGCSSTLTQNVKINGNVPDAKIITKGPSCSNQYLVKLNAATPNGAWSGLAVKTDSTGVSYFNVRNAVEGLNTIYHRVTKDGCTAVDSAMVEIKDADAGLPYTLPIYCFNSPPVALDTTQGKSYMGKGIANNMIDPSAYDTSMAFTYAVRTINNFGCIDTAWRMAVVVKPELLNPSQAICSKGDSLLLKLDPAFTSVKWLNNNSTGYNQWVADSGSYKVELNDKYGCSIVDTIKVRYKANPRAVILGSHNVFKCMYDSVLLKVDTTFMSFKWSTGSIAKSINANLPGTYTVIAQDTNKCIQKDTAIVQNFVPITNNKITNKGTKLEAIAAKQYQWFKDGAPILGAVNRQLDVTAEGKYYVAVADPNNCASASDTVTVVITGVTQLYGGNEFSVYPNPGFGKYNFQLKNKPEMDVEVVIFNAIGERVQSLNIGQDATVLNYTINLEAQSTGVYMMYIKYGSYSGFKKIVKME